MKLYHIKDVTYDNIFNNTTIKRYPTLFTIKTVDTPYGKTYKIYTTDRRMMIFMKEINLKGTLLHAVANICLRQQKLNKILLCNS